MKKICRPPTSFRANGWASNGRFAKHCFGWCVQRSATVAEPERSFENTAVATTVLPKRALSRPFRPSQLGVSDFFPTTSIRLSDSASIIFVFALVQYDQIPAKQSPIHPHNAHPASSNRSYSLLTPYQYQSQAAVAIVETIP